MQNLIASMANRRPLFAPRPALKNGDGSYTIIEAIGAAGPAAERQIPSQAIKRQVLPQGGKAPEKMTGSAKRRQDAAQAGKRCRGRQKFIRESSKDPVKPAEDRQTGWERGPAQ